MARKDKPTIDYLEAEWGDYIRRHASQISKPLGIAHETACIIIRVNIIRGCAPEDIGDQIIAQRQQALENRPPPTG